MSKETKILLSSVFTGLILVVSLFVWNGMVLGKTAKNETAPVGLFQSYVFFSTSTAAATPNQNFSTTTDATSTDITSYFDDNSFLDKGYFVIKGAKKVTMYFARDATTDIGNSKFRVQVTPDGITWLNYNKLISNVTNTNSQNLTRVGFVTITGSATSSPNATTTATLDPDDSWYGVRCIVVETTDGMHYCSATASW